MDSSRRDSFSWISDQMLRESLAWRAVSCRMLLAAGAEPYHFPIYYEEISRWISAKVAMSENSSRGGPRPELRNSVGLWTGNCKLFFGYLNVL